MKIKNYFIKGIFFLVGVLVGTFISVKSSPKKDIKTTVEIQRDTIIYRDTLYVEMPLNRKNVLEEIKKQNIPHANIVLAQSILETGEYKSKMCHIQKNLFGIRKGNKYKSYKTWKDSISDYKKLISKRYKGGNYYEFLIKIRYAEDPSYIEKIKSIV